MTHIHTHTHTYIHTCIYTHWHTYTYKQAPMEGAACWRSSEYGSAAVEDQLEVLARSQHPHAAEEVCLVYVLWLDVLLYFLCMYVYMYLYLFVSVCFYMCIQVYICIFIYVHMLEVLARSQHPHAAEEVCLVYVMLLYVMLYFLCIYVFMYI